MSLRCNGIKHICDQELEFAFGAINLSYFQVLHIKTLLFPSFAHKRKVYRLLNGLTDVFVSPRGINATHSATWPICR